MFLSELKLLFLGDETANYYSAYGGMPAWHLMTIERSAQALKEGSVETLIDSHNFEVLKGAAATQKMEDMVRHALAYDAATVRILNEHPGGISVVDLAASVDKAPELADATGGVNTLPLYAVLQILNKMRELGIAEPASPSDPVNFPR